MDLRHAPKSTAAARSDGVDVTGQGAWSAVLRDLLRGGVSSGALLVVVRVEGEPPLDEPVDRNRTGVWLAPNQVVIGPSLPAGATVGCAECAWLRRSADRTTTPEPRPPTATSYRPPPPEPLATRMVAALLSAELTAMTDGREPMLHQATVILDLTDLTLSRHRFLPVPDCRRCGTMPDDCADAARLVLRARPVPASSGHRVRDLPPLLNVLEETYVDSDSGVISALRSTGRSPFPTAAARLAGRSDAEAGYGRAFDHVTARVIAIAEALERHGGLQPGGRRTAVRGTYRELAPHAVDPRSFGLYPDQRYDTPQFRFRRYHEDLPMDWVWAYSFGRAEPALVPESYAYYRVPWQHDPVKHGIVFETSNGCAIGSCLEEAILHGLVEVAERDSFLMTWHARMPAPRVELTAGEDEPLRLIVACIEAETGYRVSLFDITGEHAIPSYWAMAVEPTGDPTRPRVICGSGAGLVPRTAVGNALHELAQTLRGTIAAYPQHREHVAALAADPTRVHVMRDHLWRYAHPSTFPHFAFLLDGSAVVGVADPAPACGGDLREDLLATVGRYLDTGLDVLVVDQTTPEHRRCGFHCVKVIVPGTLPITFGHRYRRLDGLPRLLEVPHRLGRIPGPLRSRDVNTEPHPFP